MIKLLTIILIVFLTLSGCTEKKQSLSYENANRAFHKLDLQKSENIMKKVLLNNKLDKEIRYKILKKLAYRDWKFHNNYPSALIRFMEADSLGINSSEIWSYMSWLERKAGSYDKALKAALKAEKLATKKSDKREARLEFASTAYRFSLDKIEKGLPPDMELLSKAENLLLNILEEDSGLPQPSRLLMGVSLLLNNGETFLTAWQSYFHISDISKAYPYFSKAAADINSSAAELKGTPLNGEQQERLIKALAESRLYRLAAIYSKAYTPKNSKLSTEVKDILEYAGFLKTVKEHTDEYYRQIALKKADEEAYKKWLTDTSKNLWTKLSFTKDQKFTRSSFNQMMKKHFGGAGFAGGTGNYSGFVLALGLIVNQDKQTVSQYGYSAEITYTVLDLMESIGYSTWFWDGGIGGWATAKEIIRVRSAYLKGPFNAWELVSDKEKRAEKEKIINKTPETNDMFGEAPSLSVKLYLSGLDALHNRLKESGLKDQNLKLAFLQKFSECRVEASIFAHEGRHAIDQKCFPEEFKKSSSAEREYNAKLSQITYSSEPRFELAQMLGDLNRNSESGHDKSNMMIAKTGIEWLKKNHQKVKGFSKEKSYFSQLSLLTAEQLKECYRSADKLYLKSLK